MSDILSFDEMVSRCAETAGISFQEALNAFPSHNAAARAYDTYRVLSFTLDATPA